MVKRTLCRRSAGRAFLWALLLALMAGRSGNCDVPPPNSTVTAYNSVAHLLAGDLWDVTTVAAVRAGMPWTGADWLTIGLGTTALPARNGEALVIGTLGRPQFLWADPVYGQPVRELGTEALPFIAVAYCDPTAAIIASATPGRPLHAQVQALAEAQGLTFAGVRVSGRLRDVACSVAYNLLKEGTPLEDPKADKSKYLVFFSAPAPSDWEAAGFYAKTEALQALVSVDGAPVHLHGMQADRSRGGHVGAATVEAAEIRLYPLPPPVEKQCDLTVRDLQVQGDVVSFRVANVGENTVAHVPVRLRVGEGAPLAIRLADLGPGQGQEVKITPAWPKTTRSVAVEVDPDNEVLEADEGNNDARFPREAKNEP